MLAMLTCAAAASSRTDTPLKPRSANRRSAVPRMRARGPASGSGVAAVSATPIVARLEAVLLMKFIAHMGCFLAAYGAGNVNAIDGLRKPVGIFKQSFTSVPVWSSFNLTDSFKGALRHEHEDPGDPK